MVKGLREWGDEWAGWAVGYIVVILSTWPGGTAVDPQNINSRGTVLFQYLIAREMAHIFL